MQLEGSFHQFPLRELIEMAVYSSVSGMLDVQIGDTAGRIYFHDGLPQHAELSDLVGIDAIGRMFAERDATFRFVAGNEPVTPTLWMDPWEIIDLAEHQALTWAVIREHVPNLSAIPVLRGPIDARQVAISEDIWPILAAVDGQRSVIEIARSLTMPPIDVCAGIAALLRDQLVALKAPRPPDDGPSSATGSSAGVTRDGFFERLIARAIDQERRASDPDVRRSEPGMRGSEPRYPADTGDHGR